MHVGTSLDSRDDRHSYVGYVFQNLNAFVVNLAPDAGIGDIAERGPIDVRNELPTCARQDYDLVLPILPNPVEGIDKFCVRLRGHNEWSDVGMEFSNQHTFVIACQFEVLIVCKVVILKRHSILLSVWP